MNVCGYCGYYEYIVVSEATTDLRSFPSKDAFPYSKYKICTDKHLVNLVQKCGKS